MESWALGIWLTDFLPEDIYFMTEIWPTDKRILAIRYFTKSHLANSHFSHKIFNQESLHQESFGQLSFGQQLFHQQTFDQQTISH
jgi:hypothetical protein